MKTITEESQFLELCKIVDGAEWSDARTLIAQTIDSGKTVLAKKMSDYYNYYICSDCLGTEVIVEGEFDNQIEKPCVCQI